MKPSETDLCACGNPKIKTSARCRQCHYRRLKVVRQARKWALAVTRGESIVMVWRGPKEIA